MSNINALNIVDVKELALAGQRVIKLTQNGEDIFLPVGLSSLNPNGGSGNSTVKFGYWTADGQFQAVDLSGDTPINSGNAVDADAVLFNTGKETPSYGGSTSTDTGIDFYECSKYAPEFEGGYEYSFELTGADDTEANGTYTCVKYVEDFDPETDEYVVISKWVNDDTGYYLIEEWGNAEFSYNIYTSSDDYLYSAISAIPDRITDFNQFAWTDWVNGEEVLLSFSERQITELPPTTESWSGYKMEQNTETGVWSKSAALTEGLTVTYLTPKVGEIYSADTSIWVRKMYDGATYPITSDGLVFYAPLATDYVDQISGKAAPVTGGTFTTHNGLNCLQLDGSEYVKWADNSDLPAGNVPYSFVVVVAPTNNYDWKCYMSIGYEDSAEIAIHAKNGNLEEFGGNSLTSDGKWHALALTRDASGGAKTYINGKFEGSGNRATSVPSPAHVCVGAQANSISQIFQGYVAFAAVYNRELSAEEVAEIHNVLMEDV